MSEGSLTSPEGILMLFIAGILDLTGLVFLLLSWLGVDDYGILDMIGLFFIGGWMFIRSGQISGTKGAQKIGKKALKRLGLSFFGELIPVFGSAAPCWLLCVFFELRSKGAKLEGETKEESSENTPVTNTE